MKAEVPKIRIVVVRLPAFDAGQKRVHDNQLFDLGRIHGGVGVCNHKSDVVSDHSRLFNLERLGQGVDADGGVFHVQTIFRNIGITNARQIRRNHGKFPGQKWNDWSPHARSLGVAVQQDYCRDRDRQ